MRFTARALGWGIAAIVATGLLGGPARAQDVTLDTASGYSWKIKDVGADTSLDPAKADFTGATEANGWADADVPGDVNAAGQVGENTHYWYRLDGVKIPAAWPQDHYLILTGFNVDDSDVTYFNGTVIGSHDGFADVRTYLVPPSLVNWGGDNSIAIYGTQGTMAAGITDTAPTLSTAPTDHGALLIKAMNPSGNAPVPNVLVTVKDSNGNDQDQLTGPDGSLLLTDLLPGSYPVDVESYPWIGSVSPSGEQNVAIMGGQLSTLNLQVSPFVYNIARAASPIVIDGDVSGPEWSGAMAMSVDQAKQLQAGGGASDWTGPKDLSGTVQWKWDDNYLYLAATVTDDVRVNNIVADPTNWGGLFNGDAVETYFQLDPYDPNRNSGYQLDRDYQWTIGVAPDNSLAWLIFQFPSSQADFFPPDIPDPSGNAVAKSTPTGYVLEARFPWNGLPNANPSLIPPKAGAEGAIALALDDVDSPDSTTRESQISWNTKSDLWEHPSSFTPAVFGGVGPTTTLGDINGDGTINVQDALLALRIAVGLLQATDAQKTAADVNKDGKWNVQDAALILQAAVGLRQGF